nr:EamA family transporter [uncultured Rhodoferax sp.]
MDHTGLTPLACILWTLNVIMDGGGQLALKSVASDTRAGDGLARWRWMLLQPLLWLGVGCYALEFGLWLAFLSIVPLSEGVLLGTINTVFIMLAGRYFFAEKLSVLRVAGILLIAVGVAIVGWT